MAGTIIADAIQAASTSQLNIKNGVALTPPTISDVNGVAIGTFCRAWVNFNGTGTVAINGSFNVSSITDGGTGLYTVNITNAMPDANYSYALDSKLAATGTGNLNEGATLNSALATTSLSIRTGSKAANTATDHAIVTCEIFR